MKVAILAGGKGTRFAEETSIRPKPMIEIGGMPILWHIMMHYYSYGYRDFTVALGYKGDVIKRWFVERANVGGSLRINPATGEIVRKGSDLPNWDLHLFETGLDTNTGGRIKALGPVMGNSTFMLTWGDGVSNVDLHALYNFHKSHGKLATMTVVRPPARFGQVVLDGDQITDFKEKPKHGDGWINGAFFVLEPEVVDYIDGPDTLFEKEPLERLAAEGQLMAYRHEGFWQCMDALRDKMVLEDIWASKKAPWANWRMTETEGLDAKSSLRGIKPGNGVVSGRP